MFRFEKKLVFRDPIYFDMIMSSLKVQGRWTSTFPPRIINNIYFDSPNLENYWANIDGIANRQKIRIRWYGDFNKPMTNPKLEMKKKHGQLGRKFACSIPSFNIFDINWPRYASELFELGIDNQIKTSLSKSYPSLVNSYKRNYYTILNNRIRITVDEDLVFFRTNSSLAISKFAIKEAKKIVVEFKFPQEASQLLIELLRDIPIRFAKHSKYIVGMQLTRPELIKE